VRVRDELRQLNAQSMETSDELVGRLKVEPSGDNGAVADVVGRIAQRG
jgi:hypothetical protein